MDQVVRTTTKKLWKQKGFEQDASSGWMSEGRNGHLTNVRNKMNTQQMENGE